MTTVRCASSVADPTDRVEFGRLIGYDPALLYVHVFEGTRQAIANPTRADFLAAVEAECGVRVVDATEPLALWELELLAGVNGKVVPTDALVIERAELPPVTRDLDEPGLARIGGRLYRLPGAVDARALALNLLALGEYLDAHPPVPPVDENDIEALGDLIRQYGDGFPADVARRLLATGRVSVTHE